MLRVSSRLIRREARDLLISRRLRLQSAALLNASDFGDLTSMGAGMAAKTNENFQIFVRAFT